MIAAADQGVDATNFIAKSRASKEALKSANLLRTLNINVLIKGEKGVGKTTLAQTILQADIVNGEDFDTLINAISAQESIIVKNFHLIKNYEIVRKAIDAHSTRIVATSPNHLNDKVIDQFFSLQIELSPLRERIEDVYDIAEKFYNEIDSLLDISQSKKINIRDLKLDLRHNAYSLRKSIYLAYIANNLADTEIMDIMESYFLNHVGGNNDYKDHLYLYDVPLIRAGMKKFHSQLKMSEKFGLNRNTLRKKINENEEYLKE